MRGRTVIERRHNRDRVSVCGGKRYRWEGRVKGEDLGELAGVPL